MGEVSLVKEAIIAVKNIIGVHSKLNIGVITFYRYSFIIIVKNNL